MKKLLAFLISLILLVSLCGCGKEKAEEASKTQEENISVNEETAQAPDTKENKEKNETEKKEVAEEKKDAEKEQEKPSEKQVEENIKEHTKTFFDSMPKKFVYTAKNGGKTELIFKNDGTFTGKYIFEEKDKTGDGYSKGTVNFCNFTGKFSVPIPFEQFMNISTVESLQVEEGKEEYIENDQKFVPASPEGIKNTKEVIFFLPGSKTSVFPEGTLDSLKGKKEIGDTLPEGIYILRSFADNSSFIGMD